MGSISMLQTSRLKSESRTAREPREREPRNRGAVEFGLISTTTDKATAFAYSGKDGQRCTVFEIAVGRIDVGANISFLSQYPEEQEFLMQPLSCLEVLLS